MINARDTKSGRRYDVRLRDAGGRVYSRTFRTKRDAENFVAQERADRSRGAWVDPRMGKMTVKEWSTQWMAHRPDLRPRTTELYTGLLNRHILPRLGDTELGKLSPSMVRAWNAQVLMPTGPGASTAAKAYRLLRTLLNAAVSDGMIGRNPCQLDRAGVERAVERPVPTVVQVHALADAMTHRFRALVLLAAWCGLRRGELTALRRQDLDIEGGTVRVERAFSQMADGRLVVGPPKTEAGRRTVAIPPHLLPELAAHLDRYTTGAPDALVFTGEKGGPVRPHVLQKAWVRAKKATGLTQFHLHDLRHAGNTWAAATGASTKELMSRMGHASSEAALRYQHASADRDRTIAEALSAMAAEAVSRARDEAQPGSDQGPSDVAEEAPGMAPERHDNGRARDKRAMDGDLAPEESPGPSL